CVRSVVGAPKICRGGPCSTIRPASKTATREPGNHGAAAEVDAPRPRIGKRADLVRLPTATMRSVAFASAWAKRDAGSSVNALPCTSTTSTLAAGAAGERLDADAIETYLRWQSPMRQPEGGSPEGDAHPKRSRLRCRRSSELEKAVEPNKAIDHGD